MNFRKIPLPERRSHPIGSRLAKDRVPYCRRVALEFALTSEASVAVIPAADVLMAVPIEKAVPSYASATVFSVRKIGSFPACLEP